MPYEFSDVDAVVITIAAVEAFASVQMDWTSLSHEEQRGVVLLFEQIISRMKPLLPRVPETSEIFTMIATVEAVVKKARQ